MKIIKEAAERIDPPRGVEIRFVKSQKKGWVAITRGDRDWDAGISEDEMMNKSSIFWELEFLEDMGIAVWDYPEYFQLPK